MSLQNWLWVLQTMQSVNDSRVSSLQKHVPRTTVLVKEERWVYKYLCSYFIAQHESHDHAKLRNVRNYNLSCVQQENQIYECVSWTFPSHVYLYFHWINSWTEVANSQARFGTFWYILFVWFILEIIERTLNCLNNFLN